MRLQRIPAALSFRDQGWLEDNPRTQRPITESNTDTGTQTHQTSTADHRHTFLIRSNYKVGCWILHVMKCFDSNSWTAVVPADVQQHINSCLFMQHKYITFTWKTKNKKQIPAVESRTTKVRQKQWLGANGWVIKQNKSQGALRCLIILLPWEDAPGCFCCSTAKEINLVHNGVEIQHHSNQKAKKKNPINRNVRKDCGGCGGVLGCGAGVPAWISVEGIKRLNYFNLNSFM